MGIFSINKKQSLQWEKITTLPQLNNQLNQTSEKPAVIFKHSTSCGVSIAALKGFEREWRTSVDICSLFFVDLLKHRNISNEVSFFTGVIHESPQVILIKNKKVLYTASHESISVNEIESILSKI